MTFTSDASAMLGVVDLRTHAIMNLHGTHIEVCLAGPLAQVEVQHEMYNDGEDDVSHASLLVPVPLKWQIAHITVEYEDQVIETVYTPLSENATTQNCNGKLDVNPNLFFHESSSTPVCSFQLPWTIPIGSSLMVTTQYMVTMAQSNYISCSECYGAKVSELCELLLSERVLCLSHATPNNNNKSDKMNVKEDYNALYYNTHVSNPFAFKLTNACSLHVIAQTFSPLQRDSVRLINVRETDTLHNLYGNENNSKETCVHTNNKSNSSSNNSNNSNNSNKNYSSKTSEEMPCLPCEVTYMGDCMFELSYSVPLEKVTCSTNMHRQWMLTCLLRPSLEPIRVFIDSGKSFIAGGGAKDKVMTCAKQIAVNTNKGSNDKNDNSNNSVAPYQNQAKLIDKLKTAVLIQITPHLDSCTINIEHIFVIDLSIGSVSQQYADCIAESLFLALHALPPSVYINVLCTNCLQVNGTKLTPMWLFADGSVPVTQVNCSLLTSLIAKMSTLTFNNNEDDNNNIYVNNTLADDAVLVCLSSLLQQQSQSSSSSSSSSLFANSTDNAQRTSTGPVKCQPGYVRCITLITNRTYYTLNMSYTRFAQLLEHLTHSHQHTLINTLAIVPGCNGETLAGLELMTLAGKGKFVTATMKRCLCKSNDIFHSDVDHKYKCNEEQREWSEFSSNEMTIKLNELLASCTVPHLTNIQCNIFSDALDEYHRATSTTTDHNNHNNIDNNSKCNNKCAKKRKSKCQRNVNNATHCNDSDTDALFVCPEVSSLTIAHNQPSYVTFFVPSLPSALSQHTKNELSVVISGKVGNERVEYTYSCALYDNNNERDMQEISCLDSRIVHCCERLIYCIVGQKHVSELSECICSGMRINQHEQIKNILAFLSQQYAISSPLTELQITRKKTKSQKNSNTGNFINDEDENNNSSSNDFNDEAIAFDDTFSTRLACSNLKVSTQFLHKEQMFHFMLNQLTSKHRIQLALMSKELSQSRTSKFSTITPASALMYYKSTYSFVEHLVEDVIDSILCYSPFMTPEYSSYNNSYNNNNNYNNNNKKTSYTSNMKRLMLLQHSNGSFSPSSRFALCIGLPLHLVTASSNKSIMQFSCIQTHYSNIEECWATSLALAFMRLHSCKLTLLSEQFCVYYLIHVAKVQRNVWES